MANPNLDNVRDLGRYQIEIMTSATTSTARGLRALAAEATDYSRQSLDNGRVFFEKLMRVQKLDDMIELQSEFARNAYGDFLARASKVGELCSNIAKDAFASAQNVSEATSKAVSETSSRLFSEAERQTEQLASKAQNATKQR
jgi:hypothetical protein